MVHFIFLIPYLNIAFKPIAGFIIEYQDFEFPQYLVAWGGPITK